MIKYFEPGVLGLPCKLDTESGTVTVQDKKLFGKKGYVTYSAEEVQIIRDTITEIDPIVHRIKNVFDGEIVKPREVQNFKDKYSKVKVY